MAPRFSHAWLTLLELELCLSLCWLWHPGARCHRKNEATFTKIVHENKLFIRKCCFNFFLSHTGSWEVMLPLPRCVWEAVPFADSPAKAVSRSQPSDNVVVSAGA